MWPVGEFGPVGRNLGKSIASIGVLVTLLSVAAVVPAKAQQNQQQQECTNCSSNSQGSHYIGELSNNASQVGLNAVQSELQTIRDLIQSGQSGGRAPLGYASDPAFSGNDALGYSGDTSTAASANRLFMSAAPMLYKAPPPPAASGWAVWGQGFVDYQTGSGTFAGLGNTVTGGGIAGIDKTFTGLGSAALVVGLLGGDLASNTNAPGASNTRMTGPSVGAYAMYVNGPDSIDATFKTDFLSIDQTTAGVGTSLGLINYTGAIDLNRKIDLNSRWWVEPTIGISDTHSQWNSAVIAAGLTDGDDVRVQAGARFGMSDIWNRVPVQVIFGAYAYDDVLISGGTLATVIAPLVPTQQGYVFGKGTAKVNFDWGHGWSTFVQAEVRGTSGIFGAGGQLGVRFQW